MTVAVVDASATVELLLGSPAGRRVGRSLRGKTLAAPGHLDAEVLSALGRMARAGDGSTKSRTVWNKKMAPSATAAPR